MYQPNLKFVALPVRPTEIIGGSQKFRGIGVENGTVRKCVGEFLNGNFSSVFTRFRGIAVFASVQTVQLVTEISNRRTDDVQTHYGKTVARFAR